MRATEVGQTLVEKLLKPNSIPSDKVMDGSELTQFPGFKRSTMRGATVPVNYAVFIRGGVGGRCRYPPKNVDKRRPLKVWECGVWGVLPPPLVGQPAE